MYGVSEFSPAAKLGLKNRSSGLNWWKHCRSVLKPLCDTMLPVKKRLSDMCFLYVCQAPTLIVCPFLSKPVKDFTLSLRCFSKCNFSRLASPRQVYLHHPTPSPPPKRCCLQRLPPASTHPWVRCCWPRAPCCQETPTTLRPLSCTWTMLPTIPGKPDREAEGVQLKVEILGWIQSERPSWTLKRVDLWVEPLYIFQEVMQSNGLRFSPPQTKMV